MRWERTVRFVGMLVAASALFWLGQPAVERAVAAQGRGGAQAPRFQVDPLWPKPLPNNWILGSVNGVAVDAQDHIWLVHGGFTSLQGNERGPENSPPTSTCCAAAPQVLEFDAAGNLLAHWGGKGQGYDWPLVPQGLAVDSKGNVIIGGIQAGHVDGRPDPPATGRGRAAAAAAAAPGCARDQVHAHGPVRLADGPAGESRGQREQDDAQPAGGIRCRQCGERNLHRRRTGQSSNRGRRRRDRRVQTPLGRLRREAGRCDRSRRTIRTRRRSGNFVE